MASTPAVIGFGPFRFHAVRRELVGPNGPLRIGSRALQLLEVLLESPSRLYSKEELVERVWPRTAVKTPACGFTCPHCGARLTFPPSSDALVSLEKYPHASDAAAVLRGEPPPAATIACVEHGIVAWCAPEILRLAAIPDPASPDPSLRSQAVVKLEHALQVAEDQGASFWMLRIRLSLCSAHVGGDIERVARQALRSIMADRDDGGGTAELVAARALLKEPA